MNPDNPIFRTNEEKLRDEKYQSDIKELQEEVDDLTLACLNKEIIINHDRKAYTDLQQSHAELKVKLDKAKIALKIAHEDTCDQYYLNVLAEIGEV